MENKIMKLNSDARIILMVNDIVGYNVTKFLVDRGENIVAVFLHNPPMQKYADEILNIVKLQSNDIYTADKLKSNDIVDIISSYTPDVIITCYWAHLLKPEVFKIPKNGCVNFHPALLPYNRGWYPSVWPFIDGTPAGVSLNYIDDGVDTGDIIAQQELSIEETDTAGDVYKKCQDLITDLFKETWIIIKNYGIILTPQNHSLATYHSKKDGNAFNEIDIEKTYKVKDLLNLLKARTFGERSFAYYQKGDEKFSVRIIITKE